MELISYSILSFTGGFLLVFSGAPNDVGGVILIFCALYLCVNGFHKTTENSAKSEAEK